MEASSNQKIKPSSPTPQHLRKLKLSSLDQMSPPTYVDLIFFYEPNVSDFDWPQISRKLKMSLSHVLTNFHPLAGRILLSNSCIDRNDDGVVYVETRVHANMSEITQNPDPIQLQIYVPAEPANITFIIPLLIQVNLFDCGGIAIGVRISHKVADIESLVVFMNAWAATCHQGGTNIQPGFDLTCRFPPVEDLSGKPPPLPDHNPDSDTKENIDIITKRFVFDKEIVLALKNAGASTKVTNPSSVQAVTAFLWRNFVGSRLSKRGQRTSKNSCNFAAVHVVNVTSKVSPTLPTHSFGNGCLQAVANWSIKPGNNEQERSYPALVTELRSAIKKIDSDYVEMVQNKFALPSLMDTNGLVEVLSFTSWCRFPVYEVDYGWGKPKWVSTIAVPFKNLAVFMDTKSGDGIEAWVTLATEDMDIIEANYKQLSVSHAASPPAA